MLIRWGYSESHVLGNKKKQNKSSGTWASSSWVASPLCLSVPSSEKGRDRCSLRAFPSLVGERAAQGSTFKSQVRYSLLPRPWVPYPLCLNFITYKIRKTETSLQLLECNSTQKSLCWYILQESGMTWWCGMRVDSQEWQQVPNSWSCDRGIGLHSILPATCSFCISLTFSTVKFLKYKILFREPDT